MYAPTIIADNDDVKKNMYAKPDNYFHHLMKNNIASLVIELPELDGRLIFEAS